METAGVPGALRERLGEEGTFGLVDLLDRTGREWKVEVLETAGDRFARALAEESARIRTLIAEQGARLEGRMADLRAELLKWSFLFWIGQLAAMAALLAFMLRGLPR